MIRGFQCPHRSSENTGNIFVLHFVEIVHIEDEPLLLGQAQYGLLQQSLYFIAVEPFVAFEPLCQKRVFPVDGNIVLLTLWPKTSMSHLWRYGTTTSTDVLRLGNKRYSTTLSKKYFATSRRHHRAKRPFYVSASIAIGCNASRQERKPPDIA